MGDNETTQNFDNEVDSADEISDNELAKRLGAAVGTGSSALTTSPVEAPNEGNSSDSSDDEDSDDSEEVEFGKEGGKCVLIDTAARCMAICNKLLESRSMLAIDIEGIRLGRHGEICIVQVATKEQDVFLFDVTALGKTAFTSGLKALFESDSVPKLFFDCRGDCDALFHIYTVKPANVLDMQVLCHKAKAGDSKFVFGFAKALDQVLSYQQRQIVKGIKEAGKALFAPDRGGNLEVWKIRPLPEILKNYCACDVIHLFGMLKAWEHCLPIAKLRDISEVRMRKRILGAAEETGPQLAIMDFAFPAEAKSIPKRKSNVWVRPQGPSPPAGGASAPPFKRPRLGYASVRS